MLFATGTLALALEQVEATGIVFGFLVVVLILMRLTLLTLPFPITEFLRFLPFLGLPLGFLGFSLLVETNFFRYYRRIGVQENLM